MLLNRRGLMIAATQPSAAAGGGGGATTFRYVRIRTTRTMGTTTGVQVAEFAVASSSGGTNIAAGKTGTATSHFDASTVEANALDSNTSTTWASDFSSTWPQDYIIDLGTAATIFELRTTAPAGGNNNRGPGDFTVDVSNDLSSWTNKATVTGQTYDTLNTPVTTTL